MAIALSGSLILSGSITVSGSIISTGTISMSGSIASASYANNATSASYANNATTASYALNATTGAYANTATSASYALNATTFNGLASSIFATTSSNTFIGNQVVSGSLTTSGSITATGTITAQTLVVQTITSSTVYSSGSNIFGNAIGNTQTFTGSIYQTGSVAYFSGCVGVGSNSNNGYRLEVTNASCTTGYVNVFYGLHTGNNTFTIRQFGANHPSAPAVNQIGVLNAEQHIHLVTDTQTCIDAGTSKNGMFIKSGGNIGIGMQCPSEKLEICGALKINGQLCSSTLSANSTYIDQTSGTARFLSYGPNSTTRGAITFFQASSTNTCQFTGLTLDTSGNATFGGNICSGTITSNTSVLADNNLKIQNSTAAYANGIQLIAANDAGAGYNNIGSYTNGGNTHWLIGSGATANTMVFYTCNNTERMRITCAGYVGINNNAPAYSLSVKNGWIHNYGAQNASGFRYENDAAGHVLNLNANNSYAQLYTSTDTSLYFGTSNDIRLKILNTGETCFKCNAYFCSSTYGIMGFGEKVMDKICYIMTTTGTLCVPLDGLTYSSSFPTRAIYLYGTLLDNDAAHYAHMIYFYRNDYGGLQTSTLSQASLVHPSTAGQAYTFSVNDPGSIGKGSCTLLLRFTSAGAGVAAGSYCTKMRIVVYNVPGL